MVYKNKKAISPVVATALLLVVAVVAVVGFQTWFNTYQSTLNVKVEEQSQGGSAITIERLESSGIGGDNATVYLRNRDTANDITVTEWKITKDGTAICSNTTSGTAFKNVVTKFNITGGGCTNAAFTVDGSVDVAVITSTGVYSANMIIR